MDASPANNYTVTWTNGTDLTQSVATTMETSYTITGLALDTVYTITVAAANMCGSGPEFSTTVSFSTGIYYVFSARSQDQKLVSCFEDMFLSAITLLSH